MQVTWKDRLLRDNMAPDRDWGWVTRYFLWVLSEIRNRKKWIISWKILPRENHARKYYTEQTSRQKRQYLNEWPTFSLDFLFQTDQLSALIP